jgi:hypothetical protein
VKPHKGEIHRWKKFDFSKTHPHECYDNLGYVIFGFRNNTTYMRTSPVVKHEGNEIETINSRYTLVGE